MAGTFHVNVEMRGKMMSDTTLPCENCDTCIINSDKFELTSEIIRKYGMCATVEHDDDKINLVLGGRV